MPTSDTDGKDWALQTITDLEPRVVVDIGAGEGTYVKLAREATPDCRWIGVEAWAPYLTQYDLFTLYDWVIVSDVRHLDFYTIERNPDLVIMGDILEHMEHGEAKTVLLRMRDWARHILISVPLVHCDQDDVGGNWYEIHREHWTGEEMRAQLGPGLLAYHEGDVLGYYLWSAEQALGGHR